MRVSVKTKPRSSVERVERIDEKNFVVQVREPAADGRANEAVISALARFLKVPPSRIRLVSGARARHKIVDID